MIVYRPKSVLSVLFLLTCFFAYHAQHIRLDSSVESLLPDDDPENQYYQEVRALFGSDEVGVIGLVADTIYTPELLQKIKRLTEEVSKIDGVENALSLSNAVDPIADVTEPPPLMPQIPTSPAATEALRKKVMDRPIYLKNLLALDGKAAAINIFFAEMTNDEFMRRGTDDAIQALVHPENAQAPQEQKPERLYYTGLPHFKVYSATAMSRDLIRFVPLMLLFIAVLTAG